MIAWRPSSRTLVVAGVTLVAVAAVAAGGWYWYDAQQRRIANAYAEVLTRVQAARTPQASADARARAAQDLEQVIAQHPSGVTVETRDGATREADAVVVTLSPTLAGRLEYSPALPPERDQLTQRVPNGSVIKTYAAYPTPFWREDGLNGQVASDQGPVKVVFDNSPPSGSPGVLMGFIEGAEARRSTRATAAERREAVVSCFVRYFGPRAADPLEYLERDWSAEEFTRGCYGAHFGPGTWTSYGEALRAPVGRIHWAGADYAREWSGYMEGAVRSGEAVAEDLARSAREPGG